MRRISLALALIGAVAVTGCGGSKSSGTGTLKGVNQGTFNIDINQPPVGGSISTSDNKIKCGASDLGTPTVDPATGNLVSTPTYLTGFSACAKQTAYPTGTPVVITAAPATGFVFVAWAGDCSGASATCTLNGPGDKTPIAIFSKPGAAGHPNFMDPTLHGPAYLAFSLGQTGALQCTNCHGPSMLGQGIAVSCASCHKWPMGPHFDASAQAWGSHPNSAPCYRCHTSAGFQSWISTGAYLGTPAGTYTDSAFTVTPAPTTGPLTCAACHNSVSDPLGTGLSKLQFPASVTVTTDKVTALCGQCHTARESTVSVNALIGTVAADAQINAAGTSFKNPHYRGAAATIYGSVAQGWAQYPSKVYTGQNLHGGQASCTVCHDAHTGEVVATTTTCGACHFKADGTPVASLDELKANRQYGFQGDIDGDGVIAPLDVEIAGLQTKLYAAIQAYGTNVVGQGLCYDAASYPYFFKHTGTGACVGTPNTAATGLPSNATGDYLAGAFKAFTPRLMRAAYNFKFADTDFGAWAHNPRYAIEILFDAITDLNAGLGTNAIPFNGYRAFSGGHFGGATAAKPAGADAFSHWPGPVFFSSAGNAPCAQCHSGQVGLAEYSANLTANGAPLATSVATEVNAFECTTCHAPQAGDTNFKSMRSDITQIAFPPAKAASGNPLVFPASIFPAAKDKVCATCHTGRENKTTVDLAIGLKVPGDFTVSFKNPHYLGAAGMILGSNAHMLYEYTGKTYAAYPVFYGTTGAAPGPYGSPHGASCAGCHNPQGTQHTFGIDLATTIPAAPTPGYLFRGSAFGACDSCHANGASGDHRLEPVKANVAALAAELLVKINAYQVAGAQNAACYNGAAYPYWYVGTVHPGGQCDATETTGYGSKWDAKTAKATYNYQWSQKEPGAYAHNYDYIAQTLIDSIMDLDPAAVLPCDGHDSLCINGVGGTTVLTRP
ncbi:MAG TPA: hypothetical protein VFE30_11835 [Anaeromyxobacteraceae bacterium]|jgi:hypothetical protein|nr:hypothetical protein [Anaeromyxobacteraceae bacterium]